MSDSALVKCAILGTSRNADLDQPICESLQPVWSALAESEDSASALLQAAALEQVAINAGFQSGVIAVPDKCEAEDRAYIPAGAVQALPNLLMQGNALLIQEWIDRADALDCVAPPRLLFALLEFGEQHSSHRRAITRLAGRRGAWLAIKLERWPWLLQVANEQPEEQAWKTGSLTERLQWLDWQLKHHPKDAAKAISDSWKAESPDTREAFIKLVATHPHESHESWLQMYAVTDRRQTIRKLGVSLLMNIPSSQFRHRRIALARQSIILKKGFRKSVLGCRFQETYLAEWKQDSILEKAPSGMGQKAYWLQQIFAALSIQDWQSVTGINELGSVSIDKDWTDTVLAAWQDAALNTHDVELLIPLLNRLLKDWSDQKADSLLAALAGAALNFDRTVRADLLEALSVEPEVLLALIMQCRPMINAVHHPKLSKVALSWVEQKKSSVSKQAAMALATCCHAADIPEYLRRIGQVPSLTTAAESFANQLECRYGFLKHFDIE